MPTLIVRPPWAAQPAWTGAWVGQSGSAGLMHWQRPQDLPACEELVLAVPAALLSWHALTLPKLPASRWRSALEGLLEDRLLAEPAHLHLALSPEARGGQAVQVLACDKAWLAQALQALAQARREVARIVPEFEPDGSGIHLLGSPERGVLADCGAQAVHCLALAHPAREQLQAWRAQSTSVAVQAEPAWAALAEEVWGQPPRLVPSGAHLQAAAASRWNLAQFDLTPRSALHRRLARHAAQVWHAAAWRPVRWGLLALLVVQLLGLQAWAWKERRAQQALRSEIQAVFQRSFPEVGVLIDPALQMEREVQALARSAGQASEADLPRMLAALASLGAPAVQGLDYQPGELILRGWTPTAGELPAQQARLESQGLRLKQEDRPEGPVWRLHSAAMEAKP